MGKRHGSIVMIALVLALAPGPLRAEGPGLFVTSPAQPPNVGDAMLAAAEYKDSGAYDRDVQRVASAAEDWIGERAPNVARAAVVFDIDETVLSNWDVIKRDNFGRPIGGGCDLAVDGPCGWAAWDQLGKDPAIEPTLRLYQRARALNVAVFFITGRPDDQRDATEGNLKAAGFTGYEKVFTTPNGAHFVSATDFKAPIRAAIEKEGYVIIANVGDQPSDLFGGYAERMFLLPNPFYRVR